MMESEIREVIDRWFEAWNAGDIKGLEALYDENVVLYLAPLKRTLTGRRYIVQRIKSLQDLSSDAQITLNGLHIAGNAAVVELNIHGTHTGKFLGFEPTGRPLDLDTCLVFELVDGKIVKHTTYLDDSIVLRALGLISVPEARPEAA